MKTKLGKLTVATSLSLILLTSFGTGTFAEGIDNPQKIPQDILDMAEDKVDVIELPEVRAWEVDLNGNLTEVVPLSERISVMAPPNDGFIYSFDRYIHTNGAKNWRYRNAGTFRVSNTQTNPAFMTYIQQSTATTDWTVSASISGTATIGNRFIAAVEYELGGTVARKKVDSVGKTYQVNTQVDGRTVAYMTNYHVGANSNGQLAYRKYSPSGTSLVGYYYENAGGTAVSTSDVNVEITSTEPL